MKRTQPQFYSPKDWDKERKEGTREFFKFLLWSFFWFLFFGSSLLLIGWIAAHGEQIDYVCSRFLRY